MEDLSEHSFPGVADLSSYLSVKQAARIMQVSPRSVYGYLQTGKLPGTRIAGLWMISAQAVHGFKRRAPGRTRTMTPRWRIPPLKNPQYMTTIRVCVRSGQEALLEDKLAEMRAEHKHLLPGTTARYVMYDPYDPARLLFVLIWCDAALPPEEERAAALEALRADFAEALAWETEMSYEGQVLIHA